MIKAKDFLSFLCNKLEYRFFSGVASPGMTKLYKNMSPDFMHYVPAVNEKIAFGLVSGAYVAGIKGCIIIDHKFFYDIMREIKDFSLVYKIPLLLIVHGYNDFIENIIPKVIIKSNDDSDSVYKSLQKISDLSNKKEVPGIIFIKGEVFI